MFAQHAPLMVGMTTLPSRIGMIRPAIDSLLGNRRVPESIILTVPRIPLRGGGDLQIPAFLGEAGYRDRVQVHLIDEDCGPGSKLLGCLAHVTRPGVVVIADDDMAYRDFFLDELYASQVRERSSSFSFYRYRFSGLPVGQGADGFSFWSENLNGVDTFYRDHVRGSPVVFHDDLWISYYLMTRGVAVKGLQYTLRDGLVYQCVHTHDALANLDGALARERLAADGLRHLRSSAPLPLATDLRIRLRGGYDALSGRIRRRLRSGS